MIQSAEEFRYLRLSDDPEEYNRAAHEPASLDVWREVIQKYPDMKFWVVHNKTIQLEILRELFDDPDRRVRSMIASKRKLDLDLFLKMSQDQCDGVRGRVACNRKAPKDILGTLMKDSEPHVRETAKSKFEERFGIG